MNLVKIYDFPTIYFQSTGGIWGRGEQHGKNYLASDAKEIEFKSHRSETMEWQSDTDLLIG